MHGLASIVNAIKNRLLQRQYNQLALKIELADCTRESSSRLLKPIYKLILDSLKLNNHKLAYQAVDLLKLALGKGIFRKNEPVHLKSLLLTSINTSNYKTAEYILEAFKPLLKKMPSDDFISAVQGLTLVGVVSLKHRQNFLAGKVVQTVFILFERIDVLTLELAFDILKALKVIGVLTLRKNETELFSDICFQLIKWVKKAEQYDISKELVTTLIFWLNRIVKLDSKDFADIWLKTVGEILPEINTDCQKSLYTEWRNMTSTASMNPYSNISILLIQEMLHSADNLHNKTIMKMVVEGAGQIARITAFEQDIEAGFRLLKPLLEYGRKLLKMELNFPNFGEGLRQHTLYAVVRQCICFVEQAARHDVEKTSADIIFLLYTYWVSCYPVHSKPKSIKKFCQLLLLYWSGLKRRQAKKINYYNKQLNEPVLLSESDINKLDFLK